MPLSSDNSARPRATPLIGGLLLASLGILLVLQASGIWNVVTVDSVSDTLLLYGISTLTFVAFIIFAFIFLRSLFKLRRARREQQVGSKLKTRLLRSFVAVSLLPITAMAVFSYLFFNRSLEKWFSTIPEEALQSARRVQEDARQEQFKSLADKANLLATVTLEASGGTPDAARLERLRQSSGLAALAICDAQRQVIVQTQIMLPAPYHDELAQTLASVLREPAANAQLSDGQAFDAISVPLAGGRALLAMSAYRPASAARNQIADAANKFDQLKTVQRKVRLLGLLALSLLTLLLLFASSWIALNLGRNITTPILALVTASGEVAQGNLDYRVTAVAEDEIALLADSFNQMTAQLSANRHKLEDNAHELREKNLALHERRVYIETVLESLSAGVVSFDEQTRITTLNAAAQTMLHVAPDAVKLEDLLTGEDLTTLQRLLSRARRRGRATEQTALARGLTAEGDTLPVALAATALPVAVGQRPGVVLVLEDLTDLLAAQRAAAWSDVARRLAHEIKNPLTPIQLSAERIAKNFLLAEAAPHGAHLPATGNGLPSAKLPKLQRVVNECTATIIREVSALKELVDEFSRFARLPHAKLEPADLNEIVRQAVVLYEDRLDGTRLDLQLAAALPPASLDAEQMRRVLVNLIDNALEALESNGPQPRRVVIRTAHDVARAQLRLEVTDNGHGLAPAHAGRLFQPYFSTRGRGSGLGLAIVQRIVAEHGGRIRAENNPPRGARFVLELPT